MGSRKHGRSGHATKSPRFRCGQNGDRSVHRLEIDGQGAQRITYNDRYQLFSERIRTLKAILAKLRPEPPREPLPPPKAYAPPRAGRDRRQ
jgi:hypothetical protein